MRTIIGSLADGMSADEIREAYLQLTPEDVSAALAYAAEVLKDEEVSPLAEVKILEAGVSRSPALGLPHLCALAPRSASLEGSHCPQPDDILGPQETR